MKEQKPLHTFMFKGTVYFNDHKQIKNMNLIPLKKKPKLKEKKVLNEAVKKKSVKETKKVKVKPKPIKVELNGKVETKPKVRLKPLKVNPVKKASPKALKARPKITAMKLRKQKAS